jgi:hypothetical protein
MLVPAGSAIHSVADADQPGRRIAAVRSHASTMTLIGVIKQAHVMIGDDEPAAFELLRSGRAASGGEGGTGLQHSPRNPA